MQRRLAARIVTPALCLIAFCNLATAQALQEASANLVPGEPSSYLSLIERHRPGFDDEAVDVLGSWSRAAIRRASESVRPRNRTDRSGVLRLLFKAALLHLDAARAVRLPDFAIDAVFHVDLGAEWLDGSEKSPECKVFAELWYAAAGGLLTESSPLDAERIAERGLRLFPRSGVVQFVAGATKETLASPDIRRVLPRATLPPGVLLDRPDAWVVQDAPARLREAEFLFRKAMAADSSLIEARLRLGRVLLDRGHPREAAEELERARQAGGDRFVRYLATLFLGKAQQELGLNGAARLSYEAATEIEPLALAPRLAVSSLFFADGDYATALERLSPSMAPDVNGVAVDPWVGYRLGARRYVPDLLARLAALTEQLRPVG